MKWGNVGHFLQEIDCKTDKLREEMTGEDLPILGIGCRDRDGSRWIPGWWFEDQAVNKFPLSCGLRVPRGSVLRTLAVVRG